MPVTIDIPGYITLGKICQTRATIFVAKQGILKGNTIVKNLDKLLYVYREALSWAYNRNPDDQSLYLTGTYYYLLLDRFLPDARKILANLSLTAPLVITQPANQTVAQGATATFTVVASGSAPLSYQWYKDGVIMSGKTSATLSITNAQSSDQAAYTVQVSNPSGSVTSNPAALVVTTSLTAYWYYSDTDPYADLLLGIDNLSYNGTVSFAPSVNISIPFPFASENNKYRVVRYPNSQSAKTAWSNTVANYGTIPGIAYWPIVTIGSNFYIVSKGDSIDSTQPVIYSS